MFVCFFFLFFNMCLFLRSFDGAFVALLKQRVSELLNCLNDEELVDLVLPSRAKTVSPVAFLLHGNYASSEMYFSHMHAIQNCFVQSPHQALVSNTRGTCLLK